MTTQTTAPSDRYYNNPADEAMLKEIARAEAAGEDPYGDNEEIVEAGSPLLNAQAEPIETTVDDPDEPAEAPTPAPAPAEAPAPAPAPAAEANPTDQQQEAAAQEAVETPPDLEALAKIADEGETAPPAAQPEPAPRPQYKTADQGTLDQARKQLMAKRAEAHAKVMNGDITVEDYASQDADIQGQLDDLLVQRTLMAANQQNAVMSEQDALVSVAKAAKTSGELDYFTDVKAGQQHNMFMEALKADPANASKSPLVLAREAHDAVLAMRGIGKAKPAAAPSPSAAPAPTPAKPRAMPPGPPTLRGLPEAASTLTGGGKFENMARKEGMDFMDDWSKLSKAEQDRLVND